MEDEYGWLLLLGSVVVYRIRQSIQTRLGFTVSGGIASNKLLSKLLSSHNKPNKQTVLMPQDVSIFLRTVRPKKLRGLGGKFGDYVLSKLDIVQTLKRSKDRDNNYSSHDFLVDETDIPRQCATTVPREEEKKAEEQSVADLQVFSQSELMQWFGDRDGVFLWRRFRGLDDDPVKLELKSKSMMASKRFSPGLKSEPELRVNHNLRDVDDHSDNVNNKARRV